MPRREGGFESRHPLHAVMAQQVEAPGLGPGGSGFESLWRHVRRTQVDEPDQPDESDARPAPRRPGPPPCPTPGTCGHLFHCPSCGAGSAHPQDAEHNYCGACGFV